MKWLRNTSWCLSSCSFLWAYFAINRGHAGSLSKEDSGRPQGFKLSAPKQGFCLTRGFENGCASDTSLEAWICGFLSTPFLRALNTSILQLQAEERVCCVNTTEEESSSQTNFLFEGQPPVRGSRERLCKLSEMVRQSAKCKSAWEERRLTPTIPFAPLSPRAPGRARRFSNVRQQKLFNCFLKVFVSFFSSTLFTYYNEAYFITKVYMYSLSFKKIQISGKREGENCPWSHHPKITTLNSSGFFSVILLCWRLSHTLRILRKPFWCLLFPSMF